MSERRPFLLRLDPKTLEALQRWAADEMRSLNGHIEFVLRRTLIDEGRLTDESKRPPRPRKP
jgi:hypothetical protein